MNIYIFGPVIPLLLTLAFIAIGIVILNWYRDGDHNEVSVTIGIVIISGCIIGFWHYAVDTFWQTLHLIAGLFA